MATQEKPGIYIVTLNNDKLISVNASDPRIANKCIKVNKYNFKYGRSKNLESREKGYIKTFGPSNVNFVPIALMEYSNAKEVEDSISATLHEYRIRGRTNQPNEWVENIDLSEFILKIITVIESMKAQGVQCLIRKNAIKNYLEQNKLENLIHELFP